MRLDLDALAFKIITLILLRKIVTCLSDDRLLGIIPENYNKYEPPWEPGQPTEIYFGLYIMDIDYINDGDMEYSIQFYLSEIWKDDRVNLTSVLDGSDFPSFPSYLATYIWVPDVVFDNAKDGKLFHLSLPNTDISVRKSGYFEKSSRYNLKVSCPMDFKFYPLDTQECYLKMASLSNPDYKVTFHWAEEDPGEEFTESIELMYPIVPLKYTLHEPQMEKVVVPWDDGNYTYLNAKFIFSRRLSASIFNVYIPSMLVVFLSWISFWVDIDVVPARVTLGVTSLLTLSTQVIEARSGLPEISYMTAMDIWMFVCLVFVFAVLIEFAFSYQISLRNKQQSSAFYPEKHKKLVYGMMKSNLDHKDTGQNENNGAKSKRLDKLCRKLFPFLFFLFALIYWTYFLYLK